MEAATPGFSQITQALQTARQIEEDLRQERAKNQRLAREYLDTREKMERMLQELQGAARAKDQKIAALLHEMGQARADSSRLADELQVLRSEENRIRQELTRFQTAWGEVLQRESDAKRALADADRNQVLLSDLKEQCERLAVEHDASRAEAKRLRAESESLAGIVERTVETSIAERDRQWTERVQAISSRAQQQIQSLTASSEQERTARMRLETQILADAQRAANSIADLRHKAESAIGDRREMEITIQRLREDIESARRGAELAAFSHSRAMAEIESAKKDLMKRTIVETSRSTDEAKRLEATIAEQRARIEDLESEAVQIEKWEGAVPEGEATIEALPIQARKSS